MVERQVPHEHAFVPGERVAPKSKNLDISALYAETQPPLNKKVQAWGTLQWSRAVKSWSKECCSWECLSDRWVKPSHVGNCDKNHTRNPYLQLLGQCSLGALRRPKVEQCAFRHVFGKYRKGKTRVPRLQNMVHISVDLLFITHLPPAAFKHSLFSFPQFSTIHGGNFTFKKYSFPVLAFIPWSFS